jgi:hypothetical protein
MQKVLCMPKFYSFIRFCGGGDDVLVINLWYDSSIADQLIVRHLLSVDNTGTSLRQTHAHASREIQDSDHRDWRLKC